MKITAKYELHDYDGEDMEDKLLSIAVHKLLADRDLHREFTARVKGLTDEMIKAEIGPMIRDHINAPIQQTDSFGNPRGEPVTMESLILKSADEFMTKDVSGYREGRRTQLQQFIDESVSRLIKSELSKEMRKAKDEVYEAVKQEAAAVVTDTIRRLGK